MHIFMDVLAPHDRGFSRIQTFRPCNDGGVTVTTQQEIFFFCVRKVNFGAKLSREETQERATDVGPVKNKEKKREREKEREKEREGRIKR